MIGLVAIICKSDLANLKKHCMLLNKINFIENNSEKISMELPIVNLTRNSSTVFERMSGCREDLHPDQARFLR